MYFMTKIKTYCVSNFQAITFCLFFLTYTLGYTQTSITRFLITDEMNNKISDYDIQMPKKNCGCKLINEEINCPQDSLAKIIHYIIIQKKGFQFNSIEYFKKKNLIHVLLNKKSDTQIQPKTIVQQDKKKNKKIRIKFVSNDKLNPKGINFNYGETYTLESSGEIYIEESKDSPIVIDGFKIDSIKIADNEKWVYFSKIEASINYTNKFKSVTDELDFQKMEIKQASERLNKLIQEIIYQIEHDKKLTVPKRKELEDYLELLLEASKNVDSSYSYSRSKRDSLFIKLHYIIISKDSVNSVQSKEIDDLKTTNKKIVEENKTRIIYLSSILAVCTIITLIFIVLARRLSKQKKQISYLYSEIKESIEAAKNIQNAILPDKSFIKEHVSDCAILNKPKDIVSGDFYYCCENGSKFIVAVADCTGHGIPAAFLTFMAYEILNKLVRQENITSASEILNRLNQDVLKALNQYGNRNVNSGLDISICVLNKEKNELEYAGANSPIYVISGTTNELTQYKADRQGIGGRQKSDNYSFKSTNIKYAKGDSIFLFSDGYAGQIGGKTKSEKYMYHKFRHLLCKIAAENADIQEDSLNTEIEEWKGAVEQLDDILILGLKI
jgi:serine phosphatase RsbU (regulator of sigma subunit)